MFNTCVRGVLIHFARTVTNLKTKVLILLVARNPNSPVCNLCKFFQNFSKDLKEASPSATCFSPKNLLYMKNFYCMYLPYIEIGQQVADQLENDIFSTPCGL